MKKAPKKKVAEKMQSNKLYTGDEMKHYMGSFVEHFDDNFKVLNERFDFMDEKFERKFDEVNRKLDTHQNTLDQHTLKLNEHAQLLGRLLVNAEEIKLGFQEKYFFV